MAREAHASFQDSGVKFDRTLILKLQRCCMVKRFFAAFSLTPKWPLRNPASSCKIWQSDHSPLKVMFRRRERRVELVNRLDHFQSKFQTACNRVFRVRWSSWSIWKCSSRNCSTAAMRLRHTSHTDSLNRLSQQRSGRFQLNFRVAPRPKLTRISRLLAPALRGRGRSAPRRRPRLIARHTRLRLGARAWPTRCTTASPAALPSRGAARLLFGRIFCDPETVLVPPTIARIPGRFNWTGTDVAVVIS